MSLYRSIYYSALLCGWLAFLGWVPTEVSRLTGAISTGGSGVVATCSVVGSAIGVGLSLAGRLGQARWTWMWARLIPALLIGAVGGAAGGLIGDALNGALKGTVASDFAKALGWTVMGAMIGVVDGLCDLSWRRVRNGLIGGILGGFAGGMLFDPIGRAIGEGAGMTSRAIGFTLLGLCIGVLVGLVQVVFKEAWLTVLDGDRPGRQLILDRSQVVIGRSETASMSFFGSGSKDLEPTQFLIKRGPDGAFSLEQVGHAVPTRVNGVPVTSVLQIKDGDKISFGGNTVVFNERATQSKPSTGDGAIRAKKAAPPILSVISPVAQVAPPDRPEAPAKPPARALGTVASTADRKGSDGLRTVPPRAAPGLPATSPAKASPPATAKPTPPAAPADPAAVPRCPKGHKVVEGERYCVICDLNF